MSKLRVATQAAAVKAFSPHCSRQCPYFGDMSPTRDDVGAILGSILAAEKDGLSLKLLNVEYRSIVGEWIPFKEFDYLSLAAFLGGMPEVVTLRRAPNGNVVAHATHNAATAHIAKLVAQQKPGKSRGLGPIRLRSQHTQRPCHWKVHPYHKSWTNGGVRIKTEPRDKISPPEPEEAPIVPASTPQNETSGTAVTIKSEPEDNVSPPEPKKAPLLPTPTPQKKASVSYPTPVAASQQPARRPRSPISSPAQATGTAVKPKPAALKRPEGLAQSTEPAKKKKTSGTDASAAARQPLGARRPKSPILSPAPEKKVTTSKLTNPAKPPPARQEPRCTLPPRGPLLDLPPGAPARGHADLPPGMPRKGPGLSRPSLHWWVVFLERAGVVRRRIIKYARTLLQQGVFPGSLWFFTTNDISQMGIRDHHDIRLIQEQARVWRQYALGDPPAGSTDFDEQWQPGPAFERGPRQHINFHDTIQEQEPYNDCDLRVIINRKRSGDCPGWDRTVLSGRAGTATKPKRPYPARTDCEWERPRRQHTGYPAQHLRHFEGPPGPRAARRTVRGREPVY